jgi:hypothetical protein
LNLAAKMTIHQFERKKGNQKKCKDNDDKPNFEDLPLLESITEEESDDELDDNLIDNLHQIKMPGLVDIEEDAEDGSNKAVRDEEEIVNVFVTLTNKEKECWKMEVKPIRSALFKVSQALVVTWHLLM